MTDALEDHEGTVSIGGRTITNFRFADDIDGLAGEEEELANLFERLDKASTAYGLEISAEKTKLMTIASGINTEMKVNGQKLETVTSFTYLGSVIAAGGPSLGWWCLFLRVRGIWGNVRQFISYLRFFFFFLNWRLARAH